MGTHVVRTTVLLVKALASLVFGLMHRLLRSINKVGVITPPKMNTSIYVLYVYMSL